MCVYSFLLFDTFWRLEQILQKILVTFGAMEFQEKMLLKFPDHYVWFSNDLDYLKVYYLC